MESVERFREERVLEKLCEAEGRRSDDVEVGRKEVGFIVPHLPRMLQLPFCKPRGSCQEAS